MHEVYCLAELDKRLKGCSLNRGGRERKKILKLNKITFILSHHSWYHETPESTNV